MVGFVEKATFEQRLKKVRDLSMQRSERCVPGKENEPGMFQGH